jgi:hypothetical protein
MAAISFFLQCFVVSIGAGVGRFVPAVLVLERGDAAGAWYCKGLLTGTAVFERQKCTAGHKLSKEHLISMCCGNVSGNQKLKLAAIGKATAV